MRFALRLPPLAGLILAGAVLALSGCEPSRESSATRQARINRQQHLARSVGNVANLDERRDEQLALTAGVIKERYKHDNELLRRDMTRLNDYFREDFEDWVEKQPAFRRNIDHELKGDPANIERTAPHFVY